MPFEQRARKSGGHDDLHAVSVGVGSDVGNFTLLAGWGKDRQLVVVTSSEAKVVEASRGHPVGTPKGSHVGLSVVCRSADYALDQPVSDYEVSDNSIGFLSLG